MDSKSTPSQPDIGDTSLDNVFYQQPEKPEFLRDLPVLGRWQPPHDLPLDWAASHFMNTFIIERRFTVIAEHASKLRHGQECGVVLDEVIAGGQHVVVKLSFEDSVIWVARISFPGCPKDNRHPSCVGGFPDYEKEMLRMESEIAT